MNETIAYQQALILLDRAYKAQRQGQLGVAIELYERSISVHPTAKAHTFLGWTYSMLRRYDEAIEQCELAITVDPSYGNPYNDIGAYLIELGRWEQAPEWFERALEAARYDSPQMPLHNLGRVHQHFGRYKSAIQFYDRALSIDPLYRPAKLAKYALLARLN